jgi:two-component system sensor histidine kinase MtrB
VILANLVGNALAHGAPPVEVLARTRDGGLVALSVSDHGPGLGRDVLPHVFDRFYKADTARTRSDGSGLGLAIALENARLHDGSIQAAERPGGGAVFTVWLPLRPPPDGKTAPEAVAHL